MDWDAESEKRHAEWEVPKDWDTRYFSVRDDTDSVEEEQEQPPTSNEGAGAPVVPSSASEVAEGARPGEDELSQGGGVADTVEAGIEEAGEEDVEGLAEEEESFEALAEEAEADPTASATVLKIRDTNYLHNFAKRKENGRCMNPILFKTEKGNTPHREQYHKDWLKKNGLRIPGSLKLNPFNCARDCAALGPK